MNITKKTTEVAVNFYLLVTFSLILFNEFPTQDLITYSFVIFIPLLIANWRNLKEIRLNNSSAIFIAFLIVITLSGCVFHLFNESFTYRSYEVQMTYFYAVPLFIVILLSKKSINPIVMLAIALVGCGASLGYEEVYLNYTRGGQFYGRPIIWGGLCLLSSAILTILASYQLSGRKKWSAYVLATIGILACLLSHSRGPTTLFVIMLITASLWVIIQRASIQTYILIAIAALASYYVIINDQEFQKRIDRTIGNTTAYFTEGGNKNSSIGIRFELWKVAIIAFQDKPIFGNTVPELMTIKANLIKKGEIHKTSAGFTHVHNDILQWLATRGLLGLIVFTAFFAWLVHLYWKGLSREVTKPYALAGLTLLSGILYCGLTDSFLHTKLSIFYFVTINFLLIRKMELLNTRVIDSSTIA